MNALAVASRFAAQVRHDEPMSRHTSFIRGDSIRSPGGRGGSVSSVCVRPPPACSSIKACSVATSTGLRR